MGLFEFLQKRLTRTRITEYLSVGFFSFVGVFLRSFCTWTWEHLQKIDSLFDMSFLSNSCSSFVAGFCFESKWPSHIKLGLMMGLCGSWSTLSAWQKAASTKMWFATSAHQFVQGVLGQAVGLLVGFMPFMFGRYLFRTLQAHQAETARVGQILRRLTRSRPAGGPVKVVVATTASNPPAPTPSPSASPSLPSRTPLRVWGALFVVTGIPVTIMMMITPRSSWWYHVWLSCCFGPPGSWYRVALSVLNPAPPKPGEKRPMPWFYTGTWLANLSAGVVMAIATVCDELLNTGTKPGALADAINVGLVGSMSTLPLCVGELLRTGPTRPWGAAMYWLATAGGVQLVFAVMNAVILLHHGTPSTDPYDATLLPRLLAPHSCEPSPPKRRLALRSPTKTSIASSSKARSGSCWVVWVRSRHPPGLPWCLLDSPQLGGKQPQPEPDLEAILAMEWSAMFVLLSV
ncbi:hypothetical protein PAPYR_7835 [Paratrimastix pyriformis]|uniref:CrcB-like protein n=1 Tax=Paratrimastix pyriformis TaxID=342808 RepID=A0ABQ8UG16_9EUKA|nr:hypothetical protein PAPYR_7835 [Paratrimastix pyriformis]